MINVKKCQKLLYLNNLINHIIASRFDIVLRSGFQEEGQGGHAPPQSNI